MLSFLWNIAVSIILALVVFLLYRQLPRAVRVRIADAGIWLIVQIEKSCSEGKQDIRAAKARLQAARDELRLEKKAS